MRRSPAVAVGAALLAIYFLWGSTYLGIRYAIDSLPPFSMAAVRFTLAGGALFLVLRLRGRPRPNWRHWVTAVVVGGLLLTIGNGAVVWSEQSVPSGLTAVIVSTSAIWMVVADRLIYRTRLHWPQVAGIALGMVGIVVLANPQARLVPFVPALVLVLSAVSWGTGTVLSRRLPVPGSLALANGMEMLAGGVMLAVPALIVGEPVHVHPSAITLTSLLALLYLAVAGIVAFSCYTWLIRSTPIVLVSTQSYVSPVVAVLLGVALRGEALAARELVAVAIILVSVGLIASAPLLSQRGRSQEVEAGRAA